MLYFTAVRGVSACRQVTQLRKFSVCCEHSLENRKLPLFVFRNGPKLVRSQIGGTHSSLITTFEIAQDIYSLLINHKQVMCWWWDGVAPDLTAQALLLIIKCHTNFAAKFTGVATVGFVSQNLKANVVVSSLISVC